LEYVESNYKRYLKKFEDKKEKEEKKKRKEEEEKKRNESKSATVREITEEEFERRKQEEKRAQEKSNNIELNSDVNMKTEEKQEDKVAEGKVLPGPGNGRILDKYSWAQHDIKEISMSIPIASNIRGRDVIFNYDSKNIHVQVKGQDPIVKGEFFAPIKSDSLVWSVEEVKNGKAITVTFEKSDTYKWWESLVKGDTPIDTSKINPEPSKISDIEDPEMKAQIEKMMFDTRQKQMGLPTSDEQKKNDMLNQFMKAHPEMDFSKCKFG
jgi:flagellar biosynthesis GTPase FlhF